MWMTSQIHFNLLIQRNTKRMLICLQKYQDLIKKVDHHRILEKERNGESGLCLITDHKIYDYTRHNAVNNTSETNSRLKTILDFSPNFSVSKQSSFSIVKYPKIVRIITEKIKNSISNFISATHDCPK